MASGIWKEGRAGAASLCYWQLNPEQQDWVFANHQAVGIRATYAVGPAIGHPSPCAERNWDTALLMDGTEAEPAIHDSTAGQICLQASSTSCVKGSAAYQVGLHPGSVSRGQSGSVAPLPAQFMPPHVQLAQAAIEAVVQEQAWAIWLCDGKQLAALGADGHRRLLSWLGDHHARIWCAPIRDIAAWNQPSVG